MLSIGDDMQNRLKHVGIPSATMGAAILMMAPMLLQGALAAPTVHGPINCSVTDQNALECKFNVSGLGGATTATATLKATATVTTGCITPSGSNEPQGLQRTTTTVTQTQTVNVEGGRANFDIVASLGSASDLRDCPSHNMTPTIVCASFTGVSIAVVPNSGPSRTFPVSGTFSNC